MEIAPAQAAAPPIPALAPPPINPSLDFFAGTVAGELLCGARVGAQEELKRKHTLLGVASLLCGHPFDTSAFWLMPHSTDPDGAHLTRLVSFAVKVRLQCHPKQYRNAVHALLSIVKEEQVSWEREEELAVAGELWRRRSS